ncbi:MAG: hypothetical protein M0Z69_13725, partial [Actinomycetota bacterium]|nr:hypothetical protein [Actinomycetota bacterium]
MATSGTKAELQEAFAAPIEAAKPSPPGAARVLIPPPTELVEGLLAILEKHRPGEDLSAIRRAHAFATKAHQGQRRVSGEAYVT